MKSNIFTPTKEKQINTDKWLWKMNYCAKECIPPAQEWAWTEAEKAWIEHTNYIKHINKEE